MTHKRVSVEIHYGPHHVYCSYLTADVDELLGVLATEYGLGRLLSREEGGWFAFEGGRVRIEEGKEQ